MTSTPTLRQNGADLFLKGNQGKANQGGPCFRTPSTRKTMIRFLCKHLLCSYMFFSVVSLYAQSFLLEPKKRGIWKGDSFVRLHCREAW